MLLLIGPSASGKTEIANLLIKKYNMKKIVTCTTRTIRVGEIDKVHYNFLSKEEFNNLLDEDAFVETTTYNDNYYGTLKNDVADDKILILDPSGLNTFYRKMPNEVVSFYLETEEKIRKDRMIFRKDKEEDIEKRLNGDRTVFIKENIDHIDYIIDSSYLTLDELADKIYHLYINH